MATYNNASGSTDAGASKPLCGARAGRKYFFFQNISDTDMYVNPTGAVASAGAGSVLVKASGGIYEVPFDCASDTGHAVFCASGSKAYTCFEY